MLCSNSKEQLPHIRPQGDQPLEGHQAAVGQRLLRINQVPGREEREDDLPAAAQPRGSPEHLHHSVSPEHLHHSVRGLPLLRVRQLGHLRPVEIQMRRINSFQLC